VLDLGLPDKTGFSVCQTLRNKGISTPIIFLTGDVQPKHLVHGLRIGADDYLTKPFRSSELIARVNALVRRHERSYIVRQLTAQGFVLDLENATLTSGVTSKSSKLTQTESKILATLLKQSPEIVSRNHLFQEVWGINDAHTSNRLDVYIRRLRKKMQTIHYEAHIHTTFKGYQFK
jgi:DNA-binding response OmpR family regulator